MIWWFWEFLPGVWIETMGSKRKLFFPCWIMNKSDVVVVEQDWGYFEVSLLIQKDSWGRFFIPTAEVFLNSFIEI